MEATEPMITGKRPPVTVYAESTPNPTTMRFVSSRLLVPEVLVKGGAYAVIRPRQTYDDLIAAETRRLDALRIHKKGLMQQLFPLVEEDDA